MKQEMGVCLLGHWSPHCPGLQPPSQSPMQVLGAPIISNSVRLWKTQTLTSLSSFEHRVFRDETVLHTLINSWLLSAGQSNSRGLRSHLSLSPEHMSLDGSES